MKFNVSIKYGVFHLKIITIRWPCKLKVLSDPIILTGLSSEEMKYINIIGNNTTMKISHGILKVQIPLKIPSTKDLEKQ